MRSIGWIVVAMAVGLVSGCSPASSDSEGSNGQNDQIGQYGVVVPGMVVDPMTYEGVPGAVVALRIDANADPLNVVLSQSQSLYEVAGGFDIPGVQPGTYWLQAGIVQNQGTPAAYLANETWQQVDVYQGIPVAYQIIQLTDPNIGTWDGVQGEEIDGV